MTIKKGEFIEIDYTARFTDEDVVFDTTIEEVAKENKLHQFHGHDHGDDDHDHHHEHRVYEPVRICVGERYVLPGLDARLEGLDVGDHEINLMPEEAFGKKDPKLLKLMPMSSFKKQNIQPYVGLELNIDDRRGIVRSVSGGRVIVDFNHPLANKKITYDVKIRRKITDPKEKVEAYLKIIGVPHRDVVVKDDSAKIVLESPLVDQIKDMIKKDMEKTTKLKIEIADKEPETKSKENKEKDKV